MPQAPNNTRKIVTVCISIATLVFFPLIAQGADVLDSSLSRQGGRYLMHMETVVQAPISKIHALLMDYKNFTRLNSVIKRIESVEHLDNGGIRIGLSSEFCIVAICQQFDWIQDVKVLPNGDIAITIIPNQGDFQQGNGRWRLLPADGGTRLIFDVDLTPKHWVPPVVGPWLVEQKLTADAFEFAQGLEKMAISNDC
ncbi:MAG: SRPBCC family protein [Methylomonas sp.]